MRIVVLAVCTFVIDFGIIAIFFSEKIGPEFHMDAWMVLTFLVCIVLSFGCLKKVFMNGR